MTLRLDRLSVSSLMGNTSMFKLEDTGGAQVWIKLEGNNPGGSVKDRAVWGMLRAAEENGILGSCSTIVEATSGNTGIALAMYGAALGIKVILTMPESMSVERRTTMSLYGAHLVLTPAFKGMAGAVEEARGILESDKGTFLLGQFSNPGNPWSHRVTTGPEILAALRGKTPYAFVAGVGTGGTVSGVGSLLKAVCGVTKIVAVEPASSPVLSGGKGGPHEIQGIGANFVPDNFSRELVDEIHAVSDCEAMDMARWLARRHGLSCGLSAGANVAAALKIAGTRSKDEVVVTVQPDRADKYMSVLG